MNAPSVPEVKAAIRKLSAEECRSLAEKALDQDDGDGVRQLLANARNRSAYIGNPILAYSAALGQILPEYFCDEKIQS